MSELEKLDEKALLDVLDWLGEAKPGAKKASMIADAEDELGDEFVDSDMGDDGEIPETFLFESKLIFISNLNKVPQAVGDRSMTIQLNYTKDQALKLIESKLEHLCPQYPELNMKAKKEIIKTMREFSSVVPRFSFRMFEKCAVLYMSGDPQWKQWARIQLRSMGSIAA